jgi:hypothetical protein
MKLKYLCIITLLVVALAVSGCVDKPAVNDVDHSSTFIDNATHDTSFNISNVTMRINLTNKTIEGTFK